MASLISQADALQQLRLVEAALTPDQLADVNAKAEQASAIVSDYLKVPFIEGPLSVQPISRRAPVQTDDQPPLSPLWPIFPWYGPPTPVEPPTPPPPFTQNNLPTVVKAAMLIVLTALYDGRTPADILLSVPITDILARRRDPALA
jgi:hypothetical protein